MAEQRWPGRLRFASWDSDFVDRFPICAAVRKSDPDLKTAIDHALIELAGSGKLTEVFQRWHIPYSPEIGAEQSK